MKEFKTATEQGPKMASSIKLSIIIPCYNEKRYLPKLLSMVKAAPIENKEILLIDDHSSDGTAEMIHEKLEAIVDKVVYHDKNLGKGAAIKSGLQHISGDIVIIQDADLEYDPAEYPKLIGPIVDGGPMLCMDHGSQVKDRIAFTSSGIILVTKSSL